MCNWLTTLPVPQENFEVIAARQQQISRWTEAAGVHAPIVAIQQVLKLEPVQGCH